MLFPRCPTCSTELSNKQLPLEIGIRDINNNQKISNEQKKEKQNELLSKLEINNICCRMRSLTYINTIKLIK